jgi:hypothetical protein
MAQRVRFAALQVDGGQLGADQLDVGGNVVADSLTLPAATATLAPMGLTRLESGNLPSDVQVPSKRAVDAAAASLVPIGTVVLWFGSTANVPDGWEIYEAAAGAFVMGSDADRSPGEAQGADGGLTAAVHTVSVPTIPHSHSVSDVADQKQTSEYAHAHRFVEKVLPGLEPETLSEGEIRNLYRSGEQRYKSSVPHGFLVPSAQTVNNVVQTDMLLRGYSNSQSTTGMFAAAAGRHAHTVSGRHTHPTEAAGTNAPKLDIQPAYRTLHYIRKVREPVFQD